MRLAYLLSVCFSYLIVRECGLPFFVVVFSLSIGYVICSLVDIFFIYFLFSVTVVQHSFVVFHFQFCFFRVVVFRLGFISISCCFDGSCVFSFVLSLYLVASILG